MLTIRATPPPAGLSSPSVVRSDSPALVARSSPPRATTAVRPIHGPPRPASHCGRAISTSAPKPAIGMRMTGTWTSSGCAGRPPGALLIVIAKQTKLRTASAPSAGSSQRGRATGGEATAGAAGRADMARESRPQIEERCEKRAGSERRSGASGGNGPRAADTPGRRSVAGDVGGRGCGLPEHRAQRAPAALDAEAAQELIGDGEVVGAEVRPVVDDR